MNSASDHGWWYQPSPATALRNQQLSRTMAQRQTPHNPVNCHLYPHPFSPFTVFLHLLLWQDSLPPFLLLSDKKTHKTIFRIPICAISGVDTIIIPGWIESPFSSWNFAWNHHISPHYSLPLSGKNPSLDQGQLSYKYRIISLFGQETSLSINKITDIGMADFWNPKMDFRDLILGRKNTSK